MNREVYQERLAAIISRIDDNPACWDQTYWHCGTAHCIAGHAQIDAGLPLDWWEAARDGTEWLGMSQVVSSWAFKSGRTLDELRSLLTFDVSGEYNPDGFDRAGYNRDGYDRYGSNRDKWRSTTARPFLIDQSL